MVLAKLPRSPCMDRGAAAPWRPQGCDWSRRTGQSRRSPHTPAARPRCSAAGGMRAGAAPTRRRPRPAARPRRCCSARCWRQRSRQPPSPLRHFRCMSVISIPVLHCPLHPQGHCGLTSVTSGQTSLTSSISTIHCILRCTSASALRAWQHQGPHKQSSASCEDCCSCGRACRTSHGR